MVQTSAGARTPGKVGMNSISRFDRHSTNRRALAALPTSVARSLLHRALAGLQRGRLVLVDEQGTARFGSDQSTPALEATLTVTDPRFYSDLILGGSIGAGESFMNGYWTTDDLTSLVRLLLKNRSVLDGMETGLARLGAPARKALHWLARNTRQGSRRNIVAHYDLGNDFFELFLDPRMMYSCAVFEQPTMTLEQASTAKLERICRRLNLSAGDHVLEIGTGWGGFALYAAQHFGCHVTTTTISPSQFAYASQRVAEAGLTGQIEVLQQDYRDLDGQFDKIVSIEMIEAVGHSYYGTYFRKCSELLKPDGMMLLQSITIADHQYENARRSVDFIQRYIFPGSCIPSVAALSQAIASNTDLRIFNLEDIGVHYARTLRCWHDAFFARIDQVRALGYGDPFIRMWQFYLCYCEGGFIEGAISDVHLLLVKPEATPVPANVAPLAYPL